MGKETDLRRARTLIENEGDRVKYRGRDWYYLREMKGAVGKAVVLLQKHKELVRWSEKQSDVVRFVD
jgi:hypothetical protein